MGLPAEIISLEHTITDITLQLQCTEMGFLYKGMTKQYIDFMPERIVSAEDKYFSKNQSFKLKGAEDDER